MRMTLGKAVLALVGVGTIVFVGKAITFEPAGVADASGISLAQVPKVDRIGAADRLGAAIRIKTISNQNEADNQKEEWKTLHRWLQSTYPAAHGAMSREVVGGHSLLYRWDGSDGAAAPIILMAHQDVVPVTEGTEKDWKYQPFSGAQAENAVWGRGAIDDKGSLVALMEAFEALAKTDFVPKRTIYLVSGHDEEVGGSGAKAVAELLKSRGVKALFTLDEGSAIIDDAPLAEGPAILIGVAEKGFATLKVTAKAPGGHSSMPPQEIGTVNLAKAVLAIHGRQFPQEIRPPVSDMLEALANEKGGITKALIANRWISSSLLKSQFAASPSGAAMLQTTIAPTMLEGSPKENVLPQSANALINFRIAPGQSSGEVLKHVKQAANGIPLDYEWVKAPREPTPVSSSKSQGWKLLRAAAEAEVPGAPVAPFLVLGGTDSRNFYSISQDVYRFFPVRMKQEETKMLHGTNEHITLDNLERMIRFYMRLIATSAG